MFNLEFKGQTQVPLTHNQGGFDRIDLALRKPAAPVKTFCAIQATTFLYAQDLYLTS